MYLNLCMLYYLENTQLIECRTCGHSYYKLRIGRGRAFITYKKLRYFPITLRLQRLFISPKTAKHMIRHHLYDTVDGVMVHPFNGQAQKHSNIVRSQFLARSRNEHLGLCINDINPFGSIFAPYSFWLVIFMVYNLPPQMRMRLEFMFLFTVIPGFNSLSQNINVCLRPFIDKLKQLWSSWALTYDVSRKKKLWRQF